MTLLPRALLLPLALAASLPVAAAEVWRCGSSYASSPCPGGRAVAVDDTRSAEQQREGRDAAEQDRALARQLRAERREREASWRAQGSGLIAIRPQQPAALKPVAAARPPQETRRPQRGPARPAGRPAASGTSPSAAPASRPTRG